MTAEIVLPDRTVVVQGKRIAAVAPFEQAEIPAGARVIDCRDRFLMPGLADMHMHLRQNWSSGSWPVSPLKLYLANGVTALRCFGPGGQSGRYALELRKEIEAGRLAGPSILTCGPQLRGHFSRDPVELVIQQKYRHFDFIKIYSYVSGREFRAIVSTARKLGMYTAGHIPFQVGLDGVLAQGMHEIAHVEEFLWELAGLDRGRYFDDEAAWMAWAGQTAFNRFAAFLELSSREQEKKLEALIAPVLQKLDGRRIPVCTTLVVDDIIQQKLFHPEGFLRKPENRFLPRSYLEAFRNGREKHQLQFKGGEGFAPFKYLLDRQLLAGLKAMDAPLLLSTDAGTGGMGIVPGFSVHDELGILAANGFSPYEAIAAGTLNASRVAARMNGRDEFGTIESGKRADLVVLGRNPLENVANVRGIHGVMAAGRWFGRADLAKMLLEQ